MQSTVFGCVYDPMNDALLHNTFSHNGSYGNPTNGDYGEVTFNSGQPSNCFRDNTAPNGSYPTDLETTKPTCGVTTTSANTGELLDQVGCDFGLTPCGSNSVYPPTTGVVMHPLPKGLPTMANPCDGVPANAWCPDGSPV